MTIPPTVHWVVRVIALTAILSAAPLALSAKSGLKMSRACAQSGSCCSTINATCVIGNYVEHGAEYSSGKCHPQ